MAKPNETTLGPATALYKVTYSYAAPNGQLRSGAIICDTTSAEKAKEEATANLAATQLRHVKITNVRAY